MVGCVSDYYFAELFVWTEAGKPSVSSLWLVWMKIRPVSTASSITFTLIYAEFVE